MPKPVSQGIRRADSDVQGETGARLVEPWGGCLPVSSLGDEEPIQSEAGPSGTCPSRLRRALTMTPYEQAQDMYFRDGRCFEQVLSDYMRHHYVWCSPECIIMAKPVDDFWFIELAVGRGCLQRFVSLMPHYLPRIAWARGLRNGPLKYFDTERLKGHIC
jgi:hypothetical protein